MDKLKIKERVAPDIEKLKERLQQADIATIGHYTEFGFMDPSIKQLTPGKAKLFGPALTVRIPAQESKALHVAVSMVQEGDVVVIDRCGDKNHACCGEMVALCAKTREAAAIIVDGPITDIEAISEMDIPVFATGTSALTTKFVVDNGEINYDISCGGVPVHPGDIVMADENGVLVLRPFEIEELLDEALADQDREAEEKDMVLKGETLQQLYVPEYPV